MSESAKQIKCFVFESSRDNAEFITFAIEVVCEYSVWNAVFGLHNRLGLILNKLQKRIFFLNQLIFVIN